MKSYEEIGEIGQNERFWTKMAIFGPKWRKTRFFWQKAKMSLPYAATLCKKPEQTYERFLRSKMYERTHARTEAN